MKDIKNDLSDKYYKGVIIIHWVSALLIVTLFFFGLFIHQLPAETKLSYIAAHAGLGILVLILTLIRVFWFFKKDRPTDIKTGNSLNDRLVIWIHNAFYFLIAGICLSGIATMALAGFGQAWMQQNPNLILAESAPLNTHYILATTLMILLAMHIGGVVKHYISTKENTLKRMS